MGSVRGKNPRRGLPDYVSRYMAINQINSKRQNMATEITKYFEYEVKSLTVRQSRCI